MNEDSQDKASQPATIQDVVEVLNRMQIQLVHLEKKIDNLINQSQQHRDNRPQQDDRRGESKPWGRPSKVKHFSKPFRQGGHGHSSHSGEHSHSGDKKSYGAPYGKKKSFDSYDGGKPSFGKHKKFFTPARRDRRDR